MSDQRSDNDLPEKSMNSASSECPTGGGGACACFVPLGHTGRQHPEQRSSEAIREADFEASEDAYERELDRDLRAFGVSFAEPTPEQREQRTLPDATFTVSVSTKEPRMSDAHHCGSIECPKRRDPDAGCWCDSTTEELPPLRRLAIEMASHIAAIDTSSSAVADYIERRLRDTPRSAEATPHRASCIAPDGCEQSSRWSGRCPEHYWRMVAGEEPGGPPRVSTPEERDRELVYRTLADCSAPSAWHTAEIVDALAALVSDARCRERAIPEPACDIEKGAYGKALDREQRVRDILGIRRDESSEDGARRVVDELQKLRAVAELAELATSEYQTGNIDGETREARRLMGRMTLAVDALPSSGDPKEGGNAQ